MRTSHILFLSLTGFIIAFTGEVKAEDCVWRQGGWTNGKMGLNYECFNNSEHIHPISRTQVYTDLSKSEGWRYDSETGKVYNINDSSISYTAETAPKINQLYTVHFAYDDKGHQHELDSSWTHLDGTYDYNQYTYDDDWNMISRSLNAYYANNEKSYEYVATFEDNAVLYANGIYYDENKNVIRRDHQERQILYNEDERERGYDDIETIFFYSMDGTSIGADMHQIRDEEGERFDQNIAQYEYDANGNIVKEIKIPIPQDMRDIMKDEDGGMILMGKQYDVEGNPIKEAKIVADGVLDGFPPELMTNAGFLIAEAYRNITLLVGMTDEDGNFNTETETVYARDKETHALSKLATKVYDLNGNYQMYDGSGHLIGTYNSVGKEIDVSEFEGKPLRSYSDNLLSPGISSLHPIRRIYTVSEATEALGKNNRNTFSIRYR